MSRPGDIYWEVIKWLFRYLKGSVDLKLIYTKGKDFSVHGYIDSHFAVDLDKGR